MLYATDKAKAKAKQNAYSQSIFVVEKDSSAGRNVITKNNVFFLGRELIFSETAKHT